MCPEKIKSKRSTAGRPFVLFSPLCQTLYIHLLCCEYYLCLSVHLRLLGWRVIHHRPALGDVNYVKEHDLWSVQVVYSPLKCTKIIFPIVFLLPVPIYSFF